ncbi:MAG: hypothetical protein N3B21_09825 [Clostridia bacterium]|nr:hypothetical protein [Clostridia bacterium]
MEWSNKNWKVEDELYSQKRKVNNKTSWKRPHIIGAFYSNKMDKVVEYESLAELLAYYLFELDRQVIRYYVQPVEVNISILNDEGEIKTWIHIPDVLVFRNGSDPTLYQIKDINSEVPKTFELTNRKCAKYAEERNWVYSIIYPKQMPKIISHNIKLLSGMTKKRKYFDEWIPEVVYRLKFAQKISIIDLACSFSAKINPLMILPVIYYLITIGEFKTDITSEVNQYSEISIASDFDDFDLYFMNEGVGKDEV